MSAMAFALSTAVVNSVIPRRCIVCLPGKHARPTRSRTGRRRISLRRRRVPVGMIQPPSPRTLRPEACWSRQSGHRIPLRCRCLWVRPPVSVYVCVCTCVTVCVDLTCVCARACVCVLNANTPHTFVRACVCVLYANTPPRTSATLAGAHVQHSPIGLRFGQS